VAAAPSTTTMTVASSTIIFFDTRSPISRRRARSAALRLHVASAGHATRRLPYSSGEAGVSPK
jgi:hypothetical protein